MSDDRSRMPWRPIPSYPLLRLVPLGLALASLAAVAAASTTVRDLDGRPAAPLADREATASVLLFTSPDCPISNRLAPAVIDIYRETAPRGVRFYLVYPESEVSAEKAGAHKEAFGYPFPALLDPQHELVRSVGATVLSEVAVVSAEGELLYRGRINDRFVDFGKTRPRPTRDDLRLALLSLLAGEPVEEPRTPTLGCAIPPRK